MITVKPATTVEKAVYATAGVHVLYLAVATLAGMAEAAAWVNVSGHAAAAGWLIWASRFTHGVVRTITWMLGVGSGVLAFAYLTMRFVPVTDVPAFGDGIWCGAYGVYFATGVVASLFLGRLTAYRAGRDVAASIVIGILLTLLAHVVVGQEHWEAMTGAEERSVYVAGILMMVLATSIMALFAFLAVRSHGGLYADFFLWTLLSILLAGIADFTYGFLHPEVGSGITPASHLTPAADLSDWVRLASILALLVLVRKLVPREDQAPHDTTELAR